MAISSDPNALNKLKISLGFIIAALGFLIYAQSIFFSYTVDDNYVLKGNTITKQGFKAIPKLLTTDYFFGVNDEQLRGAVYRPIPLIMLAIEWQLFPDNPMFYHLINVILYALTCLLLFRLLCKLFAKQNLVFPFICSVLFTLHPLHTEVVDSIKSGDEILCFLFGILSIICLVRFNEKKSSLMLISGLFCYLVSLLSKETGITFLMTIPLILYVFTSIDSKTLGMVLIGLIVATGLYLLVRSQVLANIPTNNFKYLNNSLYAAPDFIGQKATAIYILLRYFLLLVIPFQLSFDYGYSQIPIQTLGSLPVLIAIVFYFGIGLFTIIKIKKKSILAFAILFYLVSLAPVSNIFMMIGSPMAERFLYIPSLGFCIVLTFLLTFIFKTELVKSKFTNLKQFVSFNSTLFVFVFIISGFYALKTIARNPDWKDNLSLYSHDAEISENSARVHFLYGTLLLNEQYSKEKNSTVQNSILDKAIIEFTKTITILDTYPEAILDLGICYFRKKDYQNAIKYYEKAIPKFPTPQPKALNDLSIMYLDIKQFDKSLLFADSAIKYDKNMQDAYNNKGCALMGLHNYKEAVLAFQKCIDFNPKFQMAYNNMGACFANLSQNQEALKAFEMAVSIDSTDALSNKYLGIGYQNLGNNEKARYYLEKANRLGGGQ